MFHTIVTTGEEWRGNHLEIRMLVEQRGKNCGVFGRLFLGLESWRVGSRKRNVGSMKRRVGSMKRRVRSMKRRAVNMKRKAVNMKRRATEV